jgi:hypothetical protein
MLVFFLGGTSAHQYHGDTPICSLISYSAKMVPLLSLPASTRADETPDAGSDTSCEVYDSHFPLIVSTLIFPEDIRESIRGDFPIVPAMMIEVAFERLVIVVASLPLVPVTSPKSFATSLPARVTPGQSFASMMIVGAESVPASCRLPAASVNVSVGSWPIADAAAAKARKWRAFMAMQQ